MKPALKFPLASRLTIALAVLLEVGATFQFKPRVPLEVTGDPLTVKSDDGAESPTLVTVPVPPMVLQAQADPFHASIWPLEQVFSRLSLAMPEFVPPVS